MEVVRYHSTEHVNLWDQFISEARNTTFLFYRNFMDYHADRFNDHSVLVWHEGHIVACLPANEVSKTEICSYEGLTYGGLVVKNNLKLPLIIQVFSQVLEYYYQCGFQTLRYKAFPRLYNLLPSDEVDYCLFLVNAILYRKDVALAIDKRCTFEISGNYRREAKKAFSNGIRIRESDNFSLFWESILVPNLKNKFGVLPVHTAEEMILLKDRFPENIKLFTAFSSDNEMLAGVVIFDNKAVAHCQYIASTLKGRAEGALNALFIELITNEFPDRVYFDLGTVNEKQGRALNFGLLAWKERLGARSYSHDFYTIKTESFRLLNVDET